MTPTAAAAADAAVLFAAIITLLAIAAKLITANLIQRTKKSAAVAELRRKDISSRLKEVQLKRTSARGTLEFWERRRSETQQRVFDMQRDIEAYVEQLGPLDGDPEAEELEEDEASGFFSPEDGDTAIADEDGILTEPETAPEDGQADPSEDAEAAASDTEITEVDTAEAGEAAATAETERVDDAEEAER